MKLMKLMEGETPNLHSQQAKDLWSKMNHYLFMTDDPKFDRIKGFRKAIVQLTDPMDREQLIKYFNSEFGGVSSTPWDYYK